MCGRMQLPLTMHLACVSGNGMCGVLSSVQKPCYRCNNMQRAAGDDDAVDARWAHLKPVGIAWCKLVPAIHLILPLSPPTHPRSARCMARVDEERHGGAGGLIFFDNLPAFVALFLVSRRALSSAPTAAATHRHPLPRHCPLPPARRVAPHLMG